MVFGRLKHLRSSAHFGSMPTGEWVGGRDTQDWSAGAITLAAVPSTVWVVGAGESAIDFGHSAPDPERFTGLQSVVAAFPAHRARSAVLFRRVFAMFACVSSFSLGSEEDFGTYRYASCVSLPVPELGNGFGKCY